MFKTKLTAAAVMAAVSAPLWAQTDSVDLGEVQVTGQRRYNAISTEKNRNYSAYSSTVGTKSPASPREIPQSISILTHQQIKDRNANTLDQLARKTSGLRVLSNDDGRSSIYARGYEYDEYNVDGLPAQMQSINGTLPNLAAFDRVEVMRGPSGLFDSSGEMGGIVNLVRKRPTKEFKGHIAAGGGTHKQYKLEGDVSGSLNADGSVRGRVLAQTTGKSAAPADKNNRSETAYAAVDWDITPDTTFGAGYLYQQRRLAPDNGLPALSGGTLLPLPQDRFVGAPWNKFRMNSHDVFADLKHYFDNGGYGKIGMRYSDRKADSNYAFSGSGIDAGGNVRATGLGTDIRQKAFAADASYSQPFEWGNTANEFVVGADYNRFKTDTEQGRGGLNPSLPYVSFDTLGHTDILANARSGARGYTHSTDKNTLDEMGLYGKLTVRPAATLSLIAGGRIGRYDIKSDNGEGRLKKNETKFTGYAGAVWDMTDNHSLYASYSSLFRPQANLGTDGRLLKARQGTQIETGYKGSYFDDRLNSRISLYRLQDKNAAARIPGDALHFAPLGKRVMQGWEAELSGALTDKWKIHAGYSYLNSKIKTPSTPQNDGIFLLMPKHSGNLWTSYDVNDKLTVGGGINAMSSIRSSSGIRAGGHTTFDLMAAYRFTPKLQLQVNADNIFNRKYYTRVGTEATFNIPGAERSLMANVKYDF